MDGGLGRVTKHPLYYLSDGSVSFLTAGNTLFRVHKSFFAREGDLFRGLFENAAEDDPLAGTDARPFTLDVTADEFAQLLWVWYDTEYSYRHQTKERWITILRLSSRWEFLKIRELAVRELDALGLPPAERISIYNAHGIDDERLLSSYVELCKSPTLPTKADGDLIQMETLINVLQAREDAQRKAVELGHESPTSASLEDDTLREIVSKFFRKGSDPRSNGAPTGSEVRASNPNGERAQGTSASATITLEEPQVPDRKAQSAGGPSPHVNSSLRTGSEGKGSREREQGNQAESNNTREKVEEKPQAGGAEDKRKLAKATQDKEREEEEKREKAKQAKEREEKEKIEKVKQEREREEKEKQEKEKAKQEKEKEEREKAAQPKGQRNPYRR